jgi:hypothetical protein
MKNIALLFLALLVVGSPRSALAQPAGADAAPTPPLAGAPQLMAPTNMPTTLLTEDGNLTLCGPSNGVGMWACRRFFFDADYLMWWVKSGPNQTPLLTTGLDSDDTPGALGQPGTRVLWGGSSLSYGLFSGLRLGAGYWLHADETLGVEIRAFVLGQVSDNANFASNEIGEPFLLRPFFNVQTGEQDVATISFPGLLTGNIQFKNTSQFWGGEANVLKTWVRDGTGQIDVICGFRYLQLNETLRVDEEYRPLDVEDNEISFNGETLGFPHFVRLFDEFSTRSQFYGAQIGARALMNFGRFYLDARAKVALGSTHSSLNVSGASFLFEGDLPGGPTLNGGQPGGLLALRSNSGFKSSDSFSVVPAIELKVYCWVTDSIRVHVGYEFLYWSDLMRPGDQLDARIDPRQVPTFEQFDPGFSATLPSVPLKHGDFWAQGLVFGLEVRY